jgi:drug/metabolite transporter (DMT)-like permease
MSIDFSKPLNQWITLLILAFVWGSSFILMKRGLVSFEADEIAALRIFTVFISFLPFTYKRVKEIKGKSGLPLLAVGFFGSVFPYFLFVKSITQINSSISGILNSLTPLFTLIFARLLFRQNFKIISIIGVSLGFIGAAGLIYFSGNRPSFDSFTIYVLMPIVAASSYGINVNIIKKYLQEIPSLSVTALSFYIVGPIAGIYLFFFTDFIEHLTQHPEGWASLGYILILGVFGTALAVLLFNMMIKETSALFASSVTYLIPIFAIMWGVLDGEAFNFQQGVFVLFILIGISLINSRRRFSK